MPVNNNVQNNNVNSTQQYSFQKDNSSLDVNDFLRIMAAEISNQNPFGGEGGGSNTDYISQLAQFTTLEQLSTITESISLMTMMGQQQYSFSLIGKPVIVRGEDGDVSGVVEKVKFQNGFAILVIDGKEYGMGQLVEVSNELKVPEEPVEPEEPDESEVSNEL